MRGKASRFIRQIDGFDCDNILVSICSGTFNFFSNSVKLKFQELLDAKAQGVAGARNRFPVRQIQILKYKHPSEVPWAVFLEYSRSS